MRIAHGDAVLEKITALTLTRTVRVRLAGPRQTPATAFFCMRALIAALCLFFVCAGVCLLLGCLHRFLRCLKAG